MSLRLPSSRRSSTAVRAAVASAVAALFFAYGASFAGATALLAPFTTAVTAPAAGATASGTTTLAASVSDLASSGRFAITSLNGAGGTIAVAAVQDGVDPLVWTASWDSTAAVNGNYSITFSAVRSADGVSAGSAAVAFAVNNAAAPPPALTSAVTSPAALATLTGPVSLQAATNVAADSLSFSIAPAIGGGPVTSSASSKDGGLHWSAAWDSTSVPNGAYTVVARAFQGGSFVDSAPVSVNVLNAVAPPALSVTLVAPSAGATLSATAPLAAATNVVAASVSFSVRNGAGAVVATPAGTSADGLSWTASWDTTGVANGSYTVQAGASKDGTAAESAAAGVTVSNAVIAPPPVEPMAVTLTAPSSGATVSGAVPLAASTNVAAEAFAFTVTKNFDDHASFTVPAAGGGTAWTGTWDAGALPNGSYAIVAKATKNGTDTLSASMSVTLSNPVTGGAASPPTPVAVTVVSPVAGVTLAGTATLIAGTNVAADSLVFVFRDPANPDAAPAASAAAVAGAGNTAWTATINTATIPNGTYALVARAVKAGVVTPSAATSVTVLNASAGSAAPVSFTVTLPVAGAKLSGTVTLSATADQPLDGFTFSVESATAAAAHQSIVATGNGVKTVWNAAWDTSSLPNGDYTLQTVAVKGGNETHGAPVAFSVSNSSVSVTVTSPSSGATVSGSSEIVIAAVPAAASVTVKITSAADAAVTSTRNAAFDSGRQVWAVQWNTGDFPNGAYRLEAKAVDAGSHEFMASPVDVTVANAAPVPGNGELGVRVTTPSEGAVVTGPVTVAAVVAGTAAGVQFFVSPEQGGAIIRIDAHFDAPTGRWIGIWKTGDTPNGQASVGAVAINGQNVKVESQKIAVTVKNAVAPPAPAKTPLSVALTEPLSGNVSGTVRFVARTEGDAAEVTVFIKLRSAAKEPRAVAATPDAARSQWIASWDTASEETGTYDAVAVAKDAAGAQTTSPNVVTLYLERRAPEEGGAAGAPPAGAPPEIQGVSIVRPLPDAVLRGISVLEAKAPSAAHVAFTVRAPDGTAVMTSDAAAGAETWSVLWDTTASGNGRYGIEAVASDQAGAGIGTAHADVSVDNGQVIQVTSFDVVPPEAAKAAVREIPSGSAVLQFERLPKEVVDAGTKLSEECAAARIPAERCADWLAVRHQSSECRDAGIVTKEECVAFLKEKHGGQVPDCQGGAGACAETVAKATEGLLGADELRGIADAITPHIGEFFQVEPKGAGTAAPAGQGTPAEKTPGLTAPPPPIADILPLVSDQPLTLSVHASPGYAETADHVSHEAVPAVLFIDSDGDGLPDDVERRIGTDPFNRDTDGDGYDDGTEVRGGYNPLGKGRLADGVKNLAPVDVAIISGAPIEQPTTSGAASDALKVDAATTPPGAGKKSLFLSGRAAPGSVVTIFVYSYLPVVLTTEAKDDGTWSYDLGSGLSDGQHEVYATVTDETGKIKEKSSPLSFFVSEAKAVTQDQFFKPEESSPLAAAAVQAPIRQFTGWYIGGAAVLVVLALLIAYLLFMRPAKPVQPPRG